MLPHEDCDTFNHQHLHNIIQYVQYMDGFYDKISKLLKAQTRIFTIETNIKLLQHDIGEVIQKTQRVKYRNTHTLASMFTLIVNLCYIIRVCYTT